MNATIVMPIYKPNKKLLTKILTELKKQEFSGKFEIVQVNKNLGLAASLNYGIKKAKYDIIVSLHQDCIPSNKYWLTKLVEPFTDKEVVATTSQVHLPNKLWNNFDILTRAITFKEEGVIQPLLDDKGCAYRKKDLISAGLFDEHQFRTAGEDFDIFLKLKEKGKIVYPGCKVIHMHSTSFYKRIKKEYQFSNAYGALTRVYKKRMVNWYYGLLKAIPFIGLLLFILNYPFKKGIKLFLPYLLLTPLLHLIYLGGFWKGFLKKRQTV